MQPNAHTELRVKIDQISLPKEILEHVMLTLQS